MSAPDLPALEHANWIAYLTGVVTCSGPAAVSHAGGMVTILTGLPMDWFNQVLVEAKNATTAGLLAGIARAREQGGAFVVRLREGTDDRFIPILTEAGLVPVGDATPTPGMVAFPIDPDAIAAHAAPGLDIRRVIDAAGMEAHRQVATAGFGSDPAVADGTACADLLERPECVVYVGYANGAPIVSGLGWQTGRTIGVYTIATIETARRRGYGAAMTARVVADGVAAGCDLAALQASQMGRPIYERLGFRTVVRYVGYVYPDGSGEGWQSGRMRRS